MAAWALGSSRTRDAAASHGIRSDAATGFGECGVGRSLNWKRSLSIIGAATGRRSARVPGLHLATAEDEKVKAPAGLVGP